MIAKIFYIIFIFFISFHYSYSQLRDLKDYFLFKKGEKLLQQKNYNKADSVLSQIHKKNDVVSNYRGIANYSTKSFKKAYNFFKDAYNKAKDKNIKDYYFFNMTKTLRDSALIKKDIKNLKKTQKDFYRLYKNTEDSLLRAKAFNELVLTTRIIKQLEKLKNKNSNDKKKNKNSNKNKKDNQPQKNQQQNEKNEKKQQLYYNQILKNVKEANKKVFKYNLREMNKKTDKPW